MLNNSDAIRLTPIVCLLALANSAFAQSHSNVNWPHIGNDPGCMRYSTLQQINRENIAQLREAWTYHTGELKGRKGKTIECTPIVIDGVMYVTTGHLRVVALNAATGNEIWQFDPLQDHPFPHTMSGGVNRGCAYWSDGRVNGERRIVHGTADGRLFLLDAKTGRLDPNFGKDGIVDLRQGLPPYAARLGYGPTSAPAIWKDTIIIGVSCGEGPDLAAPGDIRAFDIRTGREVWPFRTVPGPAEFGHETWAGQSWKDRGGANAWVASALMPSAAGLRRSRIGRIRFLRRRSTRANLFANCTVALNAKTGGTRLAFPDAPSRLVGSRSARVSEPGDRHSRWQED